jgi:hypothetical protein
VSWGGYGGSVSYEAWSYDDQWHRLPPLNPNTQARYLDVGAYDPLLHRMVQFGGYDRSFTPTNSTIENAFGYPDQTSSTAWVNVSPTTSPTARVNGVLAFDGTRLVLFGGVNASGTVLDETWTYNGVTWTPETGSPHPSASAKPAAAYDPLHARMVLVDSEGVTWAHANNTWESVGVGGGAPVPPKRDAASMTFDYQTGKLVLAGGQNGELYFTDVWELDDATWHEVEVIGASPLPRSYFGFASSRIARETFLVGGAGAALVPYGDVWTLKYTAQFTPEEDCKNVDVDANGGLIPIDDDGDLHANMEDPDCCVVDNAGKCVP